MSPQLKCLVCMTKPVCNQACICDSYLCQRKFANHFHEDKRIQIMENFHKLQSNIVEVKAHIIDNLHKVRQFTLQICLDDPEKNYVPMEIDEEQLALSLT